MRIVRLLCIHLVLASCGYAQTNVNGILFADGFPGTDIGAKINAAFASVGCPSALGGAAIVQVANCPNGTATSGYTYSTPIVIPVCATAPPLRTLDLNGCQLKMTDPTHDAIQYESGNPTGYLNFILRNGVVSGGLNSFHAQSAIGLTLENLAFLGANNCDVLLEDYNGGWTEQLDIDRVNFAGGPYQLCLTNNASTPGTGSFLYSRMRHLHFQLGDTQVGLYINGNNQSGGAELWGSSDIDIAYNIGNSGAAGSDVVSLVNGASMTGAHLFLTGESMNSTGLLNCDVRVDSTSSVNTPANILRSNNVPICFPATPSGAAGYVGSPNTLLLGGLNSSGDDAFFEALPGDNVTRYSKERRHVGSHGGYDVLDASSSDGPNGGWQVFVRNNINNNSREVDTMTSVTDLPILSLLDIQALGNGGGSVGVGQGYFDASQQNYSAGYALTSVTCGGTYSPATVTFSAAFPSTLSNQPVMVTGGTTPQLTGSNGAAQTVPIYGHYGGRLSINSGSVTGTMFQSGSGSLPCLPQANGYLFLTASPVATLDVSSGINGSSATNGGFRVGGFTSTSGGQQTATIFTSMNMYETASVNPTSVAAGTCQVQNFTATAQNSGTGGSAGSPLTTDIETGVLFNGTTPTGGYALPAKITVTGDVAIDFCAGASAWTPPSGRYYVKADRVQ